MIKCRQRNLQLEGYFLERNINQLEFAAEMNILEQHEVMLIGLIDDFLIKKDYNLKLSNKVFFSWKSCENH